jgi:hypothetical protein
MATTAGALLQDAQNICVALQNNLTNGQYEDVYQCLSDLCAAIIANNEASYAVFVAGSTQTTSVNSTVSLGNQYQTTQSMTASVFTKQR